MIKRSLIWKALFILLIAFSMLNTGCASLGDTVRGWMGNGDVGKKEAAADAIAAEKTPVKFSENQNMLNPSDRQYHRMTRSKMEEESELNAQAGSMWVMEGQGAYLFSQNKTRREGDILNVKMEGSAQKQVETKVSVIKKLLKQLEDQELQNQKQEQDKKTESAEKLADGTAKPAAADAQRAPASESVKKDEKEEALDIGNVPTKITERLADGNYRIKGAQPFMIGKREYKVIVTGLIRPEDFNDEGISSNKILDPQFDVVSLRRSQQ